MMPSAPKAPQAPASRLQSTPVIVQEPFSPPRARSAAGTITAIRK